MPLTHYSPYGSQELGAKIAADQAKQAELAGQVGGAQAALEGERKKQAEVEVRPTTSATFGRGKGWGETTSCEWLLSAGCSYHLAVAL